MDSTYTTLSQIPQIKLNDLLFEAKQQALADCVFPIKHRYENVWGKEVILHTCKDVIHKELLQDWFLQFNLVDYKDVDSLVEAIRTAIVDYEANKVPKELWDSYTIYQLAEWDFLYHGYSIVKDSKITLVKYAAVVYDYKACNGIQIESHTEGDTRTATVIPTREEFDKANISHVKDVCNVMDALVEIIQQRAKRHDYTKFTDADNFYRQLCYCINNPDEDFTSSSWYKQHITKERHHLNANCPSDVNLIDVLEMIVDCVVAGIARTGEVQPISIIPAVLDKAVQNTASLIQGMILK